MLARLEALHVPAADPEAWRSAGFDVDADNAVRLDNATVRLGGEGAEPRIAVAGLDAPADAACFARAAETDEAEAGHARSAPAHANTVSRIDHVVLVAERRDAAVALLAAAGLHPRRTLTGIRKGKVLTLYKLADRVVLELVTPERPASGGPARMRVWGVTFLCGRLASLRGCVGAHGASPPRPAVQAGYAIATLRVPLGLACACLEARPAARL